MWDRKQLKEKAKTMFKRNYWKSVLVALISAIFIGGGMTAASSFGDDGDEKFVTKEELKANGDNLKLEGNEVFDEFTQELADSGISDGMIVAGVVIFILIMTIIVLAVLAVVILIEAFICNPVEVGCDRFFFRNLGEPAQVREVAFAFDHSYKSVVRTMFFRDLYVCLWALLLVIPGIVKSYEYMMIPYLLAENPDMTKEQAFAESKRMMDGQKWRAFVLDLSFLGWKLLSVCTFGILDIFYVSPYVNSAHAALYEALRYGNQGPQTAAIAQ